MKTMCLYDMNELKFYFLFLKNILKLNNNLKFTNHNLKYIIGSF